jgi:hypothetical protein
MELTVHCIMWDLRFSRPYLRRIPEDGILQFTALFTKEHDRFLMINASAWNRAVAGKLTITNLCRITGSYSGGYEIVPWRSTDVSFRNCGLHFQILRANEGRNEQNADRKRRKMVAKCSSEMSGSFQCTVWVIYLRRPLLYDNHLHAHYSATGSHDP